MENLENNDKHKRNELRRFEVDDEVTKYAPTGKKRVDKVSPLQDGPYKVIEVGESGADYKIQRKGTTRKPEWVHVDRIKKLTLR